MDEQNGRPPFPLSEDETQPTVQSPVTETSRMDVPSAAGYVPNMQSAPNNPKKGGASTVKSLIMGLAGGAVSAAAVSLALNAFGLSGQSKTAATTETSAGQTISIDASTEDATVAQAVSAKALPSVVSVHVTYSDGSGMGSGVILDTDGNIITNYHVIADADTIAVTIAGKSYDATLVGTDASSDLAVIHVDLQGDEVTPIEVGDSDALVVGDWVMSIGSPFGLDQSVSAGIVSSLARNQLMQSSSGNTIYANLIQTDASINPGNSGGALVNDKGQLVGICTLYSSDTQSFAGIGFAIPGNYAVDVANKIIAGEQVTHAYIGLSMQTVNAQNAQRYNLPVNQGAYVSEVVKDGPADKAGIQEGDIITSLDGEQIISANGVILAVRSHNIGDTVEVVYTRDGKEMTTQVTFGEDSELQKQQQQEQMQQDQQQDYNIDSPFGEQRDYGDISYEDIINYLLNGR